MFFFADKSLQKLRPSRGWPWGLGKISTIGYSGFIKMNNQKRSGSCH